MKLLGYAAVAGFTVKLIPGTAITERLEISCEHLHPVMQDAIACAWFHNRSFPLYPYWLALRVEEDESGARHFIRATTPEEIEQHLDAVMSLLYAHVAPVRMQPRLYARRHNILRSVHNLKQVDF